MTATDKNHPIMLHCSQYDSTGATVPLTSHKSQILDTTRDLQLVCAELERVAYHTRARLRQLDEAMAKKDQELAELKAYSDQRIADLQAKLSERLTVEVGAYTVDIGPIVKILADAHQLKYVEPHLELAKPALAGEPLAERNTW